MNTLFEAFCALDDSTANALLADVEFLRLIADEGMKRFEDFFDWYSLGRIHRIKSFHEEDLIADRLYDIFQCFLQVATFADSPGNQERLPGSVDAARVLVQKLGALFKQRSVDGAIIGLGADQLIRDLDNFEGLLKHEAKSLNTFMLEDIGIFHTAHLIEHAEKHLAKLAQGVIDDQVKGDFQAAGRCLAFDLFTASGVHAVRAVEALARVYYKKLTGVDANADSGGTPLGPILKAFRDERDTRKLPKDSPLDLVIANLALMNNIYRKPLSHPQMVLKDADEAKKVFDLATVLINLIAEQIAALGDATSKVQPFKKPA